MCFSRMFFGGSLVWWFGVGCSLLCFVLVRAEPSKERRGRKGGRAGKGESWDGGMKIGTKNQTLLKNMFSDVQNQFPTFLRKRSNPEPPLVIVWPLWEKRGPNNLGVALFRKKAPFQVKLSRSKTEQFLWIQTCYLGSRCCFGYCFGCCCGCCLGCSSHCRWGCCRTAAWRLWPNCCCKDAVLGPVLGVAEGAVGAAVDVQGSTLWPSDSGGTLSWALQLWFAKIRKGNRFSGVVRSAFNRSTISTFIQWCWSPMFCIFVPISSLCNVFQTVQTFVVQCNLYQRIIPCGCNIEGEGAWRHVSKCPWRMKVSTNL